MKSIFTLLLILSITISYGQDIIVKNDKTEIKSKVIEIEENNIKYKKWDNMSGPVYNISKREVFMILYANGQRELIESQSSTNPASENHPLQNPTPAIQPSSNPSRTPAVTGTVAATPPKTPQEPTTDKEGASFYRLGMGINSGYPLGYFAFDFVGKNSFATSGGLIFQYADMEDYLGTTVTTLSSIVGVSYYLNDLFNSSYNKFSAHTGLLLGYSISSNSITDETTSDFWFGGRVGAHVNLTPGFGIFGDGLVSLGGMSGVGGIFIKL